METQTDFDRYIEDLHALANRKAKEANTKTKKAHVDGLRLAVSLAQDYREGKRL